MPVLSVEAGSLVGAAGVVLGSTGVGEVVGYMVGSRNGVAVVLDRGIVGWGPVEDTLNLCHLPYPGPDLYPCPFVLDDGSRVRGSLGVVEGEGVAGTPVDWRTYQPVCCVHACQRLAASSSGFSGLPDCFR